MSKYQGLTCIQAILYAAAPGENNHPKNYQFFELDGTIVDIAPMGNMVLEIERKDNGGNKVIDRFVGIPYQCTYAKDDYEKPKKKKREKEHDYASHV